MPSIITASTASNTALNFSADTSGVLEIRTGSSPTTAMTIDGSQNVGIGTTSPLGLVDIVSSSGAVQRVRSSGTSGANTLYQNSNSGTTTADGVYVGYDGGAGYLWNFENQPVIFGTNNAERMRIASGGQVGIGTNNPSWPLHVSGSSGDTQIFLTSTSTNGSGQFISNGNGAGSFPAYNLYQSGTNYWSVMMRGDTNLYFQRQGGSGNTILSDGTFKTPSTISVGNATPSTSGAGITFPATQSASTDVNTLDDYEEGTFQPSWSAVGVSFSYDPAYRHGRYTKIGNRVFYSIYISTTSAPTGTTSNPLTITGLPFTSSNADNAVNCAQTIGQFWNVDWPANKIAGVANIGRNTTTLVLNWEQDATVSAQWTAANLLASCYVMVSGFYETN